MKTDMVNKYCDHLVYPNITIYIWYIAYENAVFWLDTQCVLCFRRKLKDWLVLNRQSTRERSFQWASTIKIQLSLFVWYKADIIIIPLKIHLFSPWYSWKIAELALNNNHPLTLLPVDYDISPLLIINFQILKL